MVVVRVLSAFQQTPHESHSFTEQRHHSVSRRVRTLHSLGTRRLATRLSRESGHSRALRVASVRHLSGICLLSAAQPSLSPAAIARITAAAPPPHSTL
mmetsp:Transcript_36447/g.107044  ORF Transcript_36447/g.107044 Transcript_36447/m.107044 type:complete len:98 (+) Transcript_36447:725-1018(+)